MDGIVEVLFGLVQLIVFQGGNEGFYEIVCVLGTFLLYLCEDWLALAARQAVFEPDEGFHVLQGNILFIRGIK